MREIEVYKRALDDLNIKGFPRFMANGTLIEEDATKKYIVISRHGYDLQMLHRVCSHHFTIKTAF